MSGAKHTPGPWTCPIAADGRGDYGILAPDAKLQFVVIAEVFHDIRDKNERSAETEPNARLIAAAPDLLEALKAMVESVTGVDQVSAVNQARAAIAKATGTNHE